MANRTFVGGAVAVAQQSQLTVGGTLAGETFQILVNGIVMAEHTDSTTVIADTVAALVSAWNASTHPYCTSVTAADASPNINLTSDVAGMPFTVTVNTPGGSATFTKQTDPVDNGGPNVWDDPDNWESQTVPVSTDDVKIAALSTNICWNLDQLPASGRFASLEIPGAFTGKIGLPYEKVSTTADGSNFSTAAPEYRGTALTFECDGRIDIGLHIGPVISGLGSQRIVMDVSSATYSCEIHVHRTAAVSAESQRPAIRLLADDSATNLYIGEGVVAGVGLGAEQPFETGEVNDIYVAGVSGTEVIVGSGITYDNFTQLNGKNVVDAGPTTAIKIHGGTLRTEGDYEIPTLTVKDGGTWYANNINSSGPGGGNDICNICNVGREGTVDTMQSGEARSVGTVNLDKTGTFKRDPDVITVTTWNPQEQGGISGS